MIRFDIFQILVYQLGTPLTFKKFDFDIVCGGSLMIGLLIRV